MKRLMSAGLMAAILLLSCKTLPGNSSTMVYSTFPEPAMIHLEKITLSPPHILDGISGELPELVKGCLAGSGFIVRENAGAGIYNLDVFLHVKKWQYDFTNLESITLRLECSRDGKTAAYRLYTEDTAKSIDSFSWTSELISSNIMELASAIYDEK